MIASSGESEDNSILFSDDSDDGRDMKPSPASPPHLERDDWTPKELQQIVLGPRPELFVPPLTVWLRPIELNQFESPIHDQHGRLEPALALQQRGHADEDLWVKQQQALPLDVLRGARRVNGNDREVAVGQLIVVSFFFAMRFCE
jgi:hypothetical protein